MDSTGQKPPGDTLESLKGLTDIKVIKTEIHVKNNGHHDDYLLPSMMMECLKEKPQEKIGTE